MTIIAQFTTSTGTVPEDTFVAAAFPLRGELTIIL